MYPIILDIADPSRVEGEIKRIREQLVVSSFDIHTFTPTPSIGIEEVRKIQHITTRKPLGGDAMLIIIYDMDKATTQAQNALLKILEEPPSHVQFILTTQNRNILLPTILSRCRIGTKIQLEKEKKQEIGAELFQKITASGVGKRILFSQELAKSKEDTLAVLTELETFLKHYLASEQAPFPPAEIAKTLQKIGRARQFVEGNINYKAILDLLFISFPKEKISSG